MKIPTKQPLMNRGFTLLELLVTISIVAILAAVAIPSMESSSKRSDVKAHQRSFSSALSYARGEAVSRNKLVAMCASVDGANCGNDWSGGWIIFVDDGAGSNYSNGDLDTDETMLQVYSHESRSLARVVDGDNSSTALDSLSWNFRGYTDDGGRAVAIICTHDADAPFTRGLILERSGRVLESRDADASGVHDSVFEADDGTVTRSDLSCS